MVNHWEVPISSPTNKPIVIAIAPNPQMGRWDLQIDIGNFETEEYAREIADKISYVLHKEFGFSYHNASMGN